MALHGHGLVLHPPKPAWEHAEVRRCVWEVARESAWEDALGPGYLPDMAGSVPHGPWHRAAHGLGLPVAYGSKGGMAYAPPREVWPREVWPLCLGASRGGRASVPRAVWHAARPMAWPC